MGQHASRPQARTALAFDFGLRRIGTAVGQDVTGTAQALETVAVRDGRPDWQAISRLVETWQPELFVIGRPLPADGSAPELGPAIEKFARRLQGRYYKPVSFIDERLSSYAALGDARNAERLGLDAVAARFILETWFAENPQP